MRAIAGFITGREHTWRKVRAAQGREGRGAVPIGGKKGLSREQTKREKSLRCVLEVGNAKERKPKE